MAGDTTVTQLASPPRGERAGRAPKTVAELERAGYARRGASTPVTAGPGRSRSRPRGDALVDASTPGAPGSRSRDLERWLGTRDTAELVRLLQHAAERYGGLEQLSTPPARDRGS